MISISSFSRRRRPLIDEGGIDQPPRLAATLHSSGFDGVALDNVHLESTVMSVSRS